MSRNAFGFGGGGRALLMLLLVAALPTASPGSDEIGLFFDANGESPCLEAPAFQALSAYLLLLDPSASAGVYGWECTLELSNALLVSTTLSGVGLNVVSPPEFEVGLASPLPRSSVVELARMQVMVLGAGGAGFWIYPFRTSETPLYADGGDPSILLPLTPKGLAGGALVAGVNLPECITQDATWGQIKRVYEN